MPVVGFIYQIDETNFKTNRTAAFGGGSSPTTTYAKTIADARKDLERACPGRRLKLTSLSSIPASWSASYD